MGGERNLGREMAVIEKSLHFRDGAPQPCGGSPCGPVSGRCSEMHGRRWRTWIQGSDWLLLLPAVTQGNGRVWGRRETVSDSKSSGSQETVKGGSRSGREDGEGSGWQNWKASPSEEALKSCIQERIVVWGRGWSKENATCLLSAGMWGVGKRAACAQGGSRGLDIKV